MWRKLTNICIFAFVVLGANCRKWNNTGNGTIVFEEAWTVPELAGSLAGTAATLAKNLLDVHNQRLAHMNANNIDFMILSCSEPCVQGISDPVKAEQMAIHVNNELAAQISNNTARFGGLASLSMHNATVAAQELQRAVKTLGFYGVLLNDYQESGPNNDTLLYYDQPQYDVFWQMVTDLDVPVYFHPRGNIAQIFRLQYAHSPWLLTSGQEFTALAIHILGLCANGVFDRFPKLKVIVGHMGERITSDLFRIDEQLTRQVANGMPMRQNVSSYWRTNLYETTSGNFATPLLQFHIDQIGLDRIMYSIDYPFADVGEGAAWLNSLSQVLGQAEIAALKRDNAIKLFRLDE